MAIVTTEMLAEAAEWQGAYAAVGVRVVDADQAPADGEVLEPSYVWVDGERTDEQLDGTCALSTRAAAALARKYAGRVVVVVGSEQSPMWGEDEGEMILRDAVALAAWVDGVRVY